MRNPFSTPISHSVSDVAIMLGIGERNVMHMIRYNHINASLINGEWLIPDAEVDRARRVIKDEGLQASPPPRISSRERALRLTKIAHSEDIDDR